MSKRTKIAETFGERQRRSRAVASAIGIGAHTASFSLVEGVLSRRLPNREPKRLLAIASEDEAYRELEAPRAILQLNAGRPDDALVTLGEIDRARHSWWSMWLPEIPALFGLSGRPEFAALLRGEQAPRR